jgi:hypothetical protein
LLNADTLTGLCFMVFGAAAIWIGSGYDMGTATQTGPGYFPRLLAWLCIGLSGILVLRGVWSASEALPKVDLRAAAFLFAGILAFAGLIERFGLVAASTSLVVLVSLARPRPNWLRVALLAAGLAVFSTILFVELLGLPLSIGPR